VLRDFFKGRELFFFSALLVCGLLISAPLNVYCQNAGLKYLKNYSPKDYKDQPQNWWILQDKRGIIYVANHGGVLEFDGVNWREIVVPNKTVRSMAIDHTGTVYIGGNNEIGFLAPDPDRSLKYVSLLEHLEKNKRNFSNVWATHSAKEGIYFKTTKFLIRWDSKQKKMTVWESGKGHVYSVSSVCDGKFYMLKKPLGLMQLVKNSLTLIPGGEVFAGRRIYMMVPYDSNKMLIGTRSNGFYIYDGKTTVPFPTEAGDFLKKDKKLSHGIRLLNGDFALATLQGGLLIMDSRGNIKHIFDMSSGLQNDNVKHVFEDSHGNLWLALGSGITKIEYRSPISVYGSGANLFGLVLTVTRHQNNLYAGTTRGLFSFASTGKFRPVPDITVNCFFLLSTANGLLAATDGGVFQVENNSTRLVSKTPSFFLCRSQIDINRIWVGTTSGLVSLYRESEKSQWTEEREFENTAQRIRTIVEDKKENLWLGTETKGVVKVDFPVAGTINNPVISHYSHDTSAGLPPVEVHVFMAAGHVIFATDKGIFRFDKKNKTFIPDPTLGDEFTDGSRGVFRIVEDKNNNIWFHSNKRNIQAIPQPDGAFVLNKKSFLRIPRAGVNAIYPDPLSDVIWFAGNNGLIRYDTGIKKNYKSPYSTFIRKVLINGKPVFKGYKYDPKLLLPVIDYKDRNLRFEYAAPFFEDEEATRYQYFLDGYEGDWSEWTAETRKDYTNLDSGTYSFRVKAKNIYKDESREATFQFKVLPPWYKTWWAFSLYAVAIFFIIVFIVKWRSLKLELEKKRLEHIIGERTKEIIDKNQQLEEQSEKLKEVDHVKSRFFANISHEFRTPLTLIMGPLEQMLGDCAEKGRQKKLDLMLRNSQRLLALINQLLELSKFESGQVKLNASQKDIVPFLKGTVASFELLGTQRELDITFHTDQEKIPLFFDLGKMEEVMCNILINAVKFTPPGGNITVKAKESPGFVEITIADTGPGIPPEQLSHIFERFYQSATTHEYNRKGTGIGLAIAKELVELHHGEIQVKSEQGKGTEFTIRLPMGDTHLEPDEIDHAPETPAEKTEPGKIPAHYIDMIEPAAENGAAEEEPAGSEGEEEKNIILVVEDSRDVRDYIRNSIESLYKVVEAKDGSEGISKAREIIPDLIISDIMMPGADGYELCKELKNAVETSHIPIVLLTAKASEENILEGIEVGADDYITKPFNTKILLARIKNLIDLRRQLQLNLNREMTFQPVKTSVSEIDREFLNDLQTVLNENISDPEFNVELLSKKLYMSHATLYRKINALSGENPSAFIRTYRLKRAAELLKRNFGTVLEVSFEVGFASSSYFTKCFKEKYHQLPSTFQASEAQH
jgi:signal transduction histidine kinase/DNA-binding response OmpR family regulator